MKQFLRRLRGVIKTGLTWAVGCVAIMAGVTAFGGWLQIPMAQWSVFFSQIPIYATFGFIMGSAFAGILSLTERHKRLADLSLRRVALWGALGSLVFLGGFSLMFNPPNLMSWLIMASLSAGLASGSVALAQRGEAKLIEGEDQAPSLEGDDESLPALEGE
jgi:hypothetical protein